MLIGSAIEPAAGGQSNSHHTYTRSHGLLELKLEYFLARAFRA
jgi:hypothetical protein